MKDYKAVKKDVLRDKYFTTITYEYRGCEYEVTYANDWTCCTTPAHIQHRDEQAKIDDFIDNPKPESNFKSKPANIDEIFELMGW